MLRKLFSTLFGNFLGFYFFGPKFLLIVGNYVLVYFIMLFSPSRKIGAQVGIVVSGIVLMIGHFQYWRMSMKGHDYNTGQMIAFAKMHMTLCSLWDAEKVLNDEKRSKKEDDGAELETKWMTARERHNASYLLTLPSFIDWVHYMSFMVSISIGPMCEYSTFHDFINLKDSCDATKMRPFSNWFTAWRRFIEVWLCAALYMILVEKFDWWYLAGSEFLNDSLWYKLYYLLMSMQVMIWQLFTGFATQEANMIACGLSYKAATKDEPEEFNYVRMVKIKDFELMNNPV